LVCALVANTPHIPAFSFGSFQVRGDAPLEYDNMRVDGSGLLAKIQLIEILGVIFVASTSGHNGPPVA
jgi:hypothetical protein